MLGIAGASWGPRQHIFAVRRDLMDDASYRTLMASARVVLHTHNGTVFDQIERAATMEESERGGAAGDACQRGRDKAWRRAPAR